MELAVYKLSLFGPCIYHLIYLYRNQHIDNVPSGSRRRTKTMSEKEEWKHHLYGIHTRPQRYQLSIGTHDVSMSCILPGCKNRSRGLTWKTVSQAFEQTI